MGKEIGGYIEFEHYNQKMLHENAIALNCGRNALAYLVEAKGIKAIVMPKFMCDSCEHILRKHDVSIRYYSVGLDFKIKEMEVQTDEWLYVVNFYGQLSNEYIKSLQKRYGNIIVDQAQAYFQMPIDRVDTLYTCRKFFGVADGAILYTDKTLNRDIPQDESFERMNFLLGRFERTATEFYPEYIANNCSFEKTTIKSMSKLTENLLRGIDYEMVRNQRTENFTYLHRRLNALNKLELTVPDGAFMYPLYIENGAAVRRALQKEKIYIPTLWPSVFKLCDTTDLEYDMAMNILPLPVDQRYNESDMEYICERILEHIR